jgi:transposase
LSEGERNELEKLFAQMPELEQVYWIRWNITDIFDTAEDREEAAARLQEYRDMLDDNDAELLAFFSTYESHKDGILAYFDEGKNSGVVEGINNKARVITKRCYGVKQAETLWQRLCLDINVAGQVLRRTVGEMKSLINRIRTKFLGYYT